ncbi:hypothetical protein, partial [Lactobacillus helveticus]|uniref:hypothetical protein n=1 Tax=Lactobacillus helveticus TaxID=1587 RepID=UPI001C64D978
MCNYRAAGLKPLRNENRRKSEQVLHKTMFIQYFWKNATSDNLNRKTSALIKPYVKIQNGTEV